MSLDCCRRCGLPAEQSGIAFSKVCDRDDCSQKKQNEFINSIFGRTHVRSSESDIEALRLLREAREYMYTHDLPPFRSKRQLLKEIDTLLALADKEHDTYGVANLRSAFEPAPAALSTEKQK